MTQSQVEQTQWYLTTRPLYDRLGQAVVGILTALLRTEQIDYLAVTYRAKSAESFAAKLKRKNYADPRTEVMDLCGIRIVTYLETDVTRVVQVLRGAFKVDEMNSVDKSTALEVDRVGYRSVHLVCALGDSRAPLGEYASFKGLHFEVQVRTALQHAWAQVEHDRNYKFGGVLPTELQRRLHLAAGALELVDQEFDRIASLVDAYALSVQVEASHGTPDVDLNTTSLRSLLLSRASKLNATFVPLVGSASQSEIIEELRRYGLRSLADVDALLTDEFFEARNKHPEEDNRTNEYGLMRDAMMFADLHRYFGSAFAKGWNGLDSSGFRFLSQKHGESAVRLAMRKHRIKLLDSDRTT